ncbi:MAG: Xaa-Pro dipeptidase [Yoonia sp.]
MEYYSDQRKISSLYGDRLPDGTLNDGDRVEIGPTELAFGEWEAAGLTLPNLGAMREYRWKRLTQHIVDRGFGGLLVFDPLNIRYATDTTNMQLWNTHNPFRAVLLCADGYMVIWDYKNTPFLADYNPLVRESRSGASMFYFSSGDQVDAVAETFVGQVEDLMRQHAGTNKRLAVDKIQIQGLRALEKVGFIVEEGEELTEKARAIKGPDELLAMRCASVACENAVAIMEEATTPGMTEDDIWAILHAENIRRGGEWIETRLLATGPRTNPWFQECGPRRLHNNEILAFDTDLIGSYGICVDISRTWWIGDQDPRPDMVYAMQHAHEHIMENMELLKPGVMLKDVSFKGHKLDAQFQKQKYGSMMHGAGLCDEWPRIPYPDTWVDGAFDHPLKEGMVMCVEALVSPEGGDFSIKLEDQVVITENGYENLTKYPFDPRLMGTA